MNEPGDFNGWLIFAILAATLVGLGVYLLGRWLDNRDRERQQEELRKLRREQAEFERRSIETLEQARRLLHTRAAQPRPWPFPTPSRAPEPRYRPGHTDPRSLRQRIQDAAPEPRRYDTSDFVSDQPIYPWTGETGTALPGWAQESKPVPFRSGGGGEFAGGGASGSWAPEVNPRFDSAGIDGSSPSPSPSYNSSSPSPSPSYDSSSGSSSSSSSSSE